MFRSSLGMLEQRGDNMESLMNFDLQQQSPMAAYRQVQKLLIKSGKNVFKDRANPYDVGIYDADQFFGAVGGTPQMQQYNNYMPAQKRARHSPQAPPIFQ